MIIKTIGSLPESYAAQTLLQQARPVDPLRSLVNLFEPYLIFKFSSKVSLSVKYYFTNSETENNVQTTPPPKQTYRNTVRITHRCLEIAQCTSNFFLSLVTTPRA